MFTFWHFYVIVLLVVTCWGITLLNRIPVAKLRISQNNGLLQLRAFSDMSIGFSRGSEGGLVSN